MGQSESDATFFERPEIRQLFRSVFSTLMVESDRGAVLIGASHVDFHLRDLFETIGPQSISRGELRRTLEYPGPLSSLSAKADVALITRLISDSLHQAIHHLRRIRNDVAHSPNQFRLADHRHQLREMYEFIGPELPVAINRYAAQLILDVAVQNVMSVKDPSDQSKPIFDSPEQVLDHFSQDSEILSTLDERRPRCELAYGVSFICGLIILNRDKIKGVLGENTGSLAFLKPKP